MRPPPPPLAASEWPPLADSGAGGEKLASFMAQNYKENN
jgi:hypothetical protein